MPAQAQGSFEVEMTPQDPGGPINRFTLAKRFGGALDATSVGAMLSFRSPVAGSAGYVAMEQVTGTLDGRPGSFVLQHSGTMDRMASGLSVTVVPDSGTGTLAGLTGTLSITMTDGQHRYDFRYALPDGSDPG